jgi:hypothetical protein
MPNKHNRNESSTNDTMRTTKSEGEKAEILKRCVINILKCFRVCKKSHMSTKKA